MPGLAVAVGQNGKVIWQENFGHSDLETRVAVTADTCFRLGSVSKVVTIGALARLVDRGELDLDAPIQKYVPSVPSSLSTITTRQLAGHLAGIRHYAPKDFIEPECQNFKTVTESLAKFINDPVVNAPGEKYSYSTYGYVLLSAVMESATKRDFLKLLEEEVFRPLEMKRSGPDFIRQIIPSRTRYYERTEGEILLAPFSDTSYKWAGGGLIATTGDLIRFGFAHLQDGYLSEATRSLLFTSQKTKTGEETGTGLGWRIGKDAFDRRIYHHGGSQSGCRAMIMMYPDQNLVVSILSNLSGEPPGIDRTAQIVANSFLNEKRRDSEISGKFVLTGKDQEKDFTAEMEIKRGQGTISETFPLATFSAKNKYPSRLAIVDAVQMQNRILLVVASAFGLVDVSLYPENGGYKGVLEAGPVKTEFRATKQKN